LSVRSACKTFSCTNKFHIVPISKSNDPGYWEFERKGDGGRPALAGGKPEPCPANKMPCSWWSAFGRAAAELRAGAPANFQACAVMRVRCWFPPLSAFAFRTPGKDHDIFYPFWVRPGDAEQAGGGEFRFRFAAWRRAPLSARRPARLGRRFCNGQTKENDIKRKL
jgi:hypothetical protein